jgi:hypothetical protein
MNDYLINRNKSYFCETTFVPHKSYSQEFNNAIDLLQFFISKSVLARGQALRKKYLYSYSAEHCWKNNNFTFSESETCEKLLFENDRILNQSNSFIQEFRVDMLDEYEKQVARNNQLQLSNNKAETYEKLHRNFLFKMHLWYRFYYYYLGKSLFVNSYKQDN